MAARWWSSGPSRKATDEVVEVPAAASASSAARWVTLRASAATGVRLVAVAADRTEIADVVVVATEAVTEAETAVAIEAATAAVIAAVIDITGNCQFGQLAKNNRLY